MGRKTVLVSTYNNLCLFFSGGRPRLQVDQGGAHAPQESHRPAGDLRAAGRPRVPGPEVQVS